MRPPLTTVAQLECVTNPTRRRLFQLLSAHGPLSLSELSEHCGKSTEALNYHIKCLVEVSLVTVASYRTVGKTRARIFQRADVDLMPPPEAFEPGSEWGPAVKKLVRNEADALMDDVVAGFDRADAVFFGPNRNLEFVVHPIRLKKSGVRELVTWFDRLDELLEEYRPGPDEEAQTFRIGRILAPIDGDDH